MLQRLEREMREASERREYELAAKLRDQLAAARRALENQEMVLTQAEDLDVIALVEDDLEAAFQAFFVRRGRVKGRKGWVADRVEELDRPELLASFLRELYMERQEVPARILVPEQPADADLLTRWLSMRREGRVAFAVPERGTKRKLMETVSQNAREHFQRHKLKRASDFGARSRALSELGTALGLEQAPLRIECYDISNLGPTDKVGSMVVFEDGLPKRSDYRRFEIKGVVGQDDFASMEEMLRRRFARLHERRGRAEAPPVRVSAITGGRRRRTRAARGGERRPRRRTGCTSRRSGSRSVSRRSTCPGRPDPLVIARGSEALFVLQHLRDEAHRFAIAYHRQKREKRALASPLDDIPGVGPARKKALLKRFGSLAGCRARTSRRSRRRRASAPRSRAPSTSG